jgi:hypothetical protein
MLMVVFGAGASFDSYSSKPPDRHDPDSLIEQRRPPLADDLFDERTSFVSVTDRFPAMQPLLPSLRRRPPGQSLEAYLARLDSENRPQRREQFAALRYYLQAAVSVCEQGWRSGLLHEATNQAAFLDQVERWRWGRSKTESVWLVTFNYDTMLEAALRHHLPSPITALDHYLSEGQLYNLVKLHGSIHWYREVDDFTGTKEMSDADGARVLGKAVGAGTLKISQRYYCHASGTAAVTYRHDTGQTIYPAITIPVEGKQDFECPEDHLVALTEALPQMDRLIVIGWRAAEEHFLDLGPAKQ